MKRFLFIFVAFILSINIALAANSVTDTLHEGEIETYDLEGTAYMVVVNSVNEATPHTANFIVNGQSTTDLEDEQSFKFFDDSSIQIRSFSLNATDSNNDAVTFELRLNRAPTINIPLSRTLIEGDATTLNLTQFSSDPDGDTLAFIVLSENTSAVDCDITGSILTAQAQTGFVGNSPCTIEVSDSPSNSAQPKTANDTITFIVQAKDFSFGVPSLLNVGNAFAGKTVSQTYTITNQGNMPLTNINVTHSIDAAYQATISIGNVTQLDPGRSATATLTLTIPKNERNGQRTIGSIQYRAVNNASASSAVQINVEGRLRISQLDVVVDTEKDDDVKDGDLISEDAEPFDKVKFDVEVENLFSTADDIKIKDVKVEITINEIDDGRDLDDETAEKNLDPSDEETFSLTFDMPRDTKDDTYDTEIKVTGKDDDGVKHSVTWNVKLRLRKKAQDLRFFDVRLNPSTIECGGSVLLSFELVNLGRDQEEQVKFSVENSDLNIAIRQNTIVLDEDPDDNSVAKSYRIQIPEDIPTGTYPIELKAFFRSTILDDLQKVNLQVTCGTQSIVQRNQTQPVQNVPKVTSQFNQTVQKDVKQPTAITITQAPNMLVYLVAGNVLLLVIVILLAARYLTRTE